MPEEDITQSREYQKGYQDAMYFQCELHDEKSKEAYNKGWIEAFEDLRKKYIQSQEYKEKVQRGEHTLLTITHWNGEKEDVTDWDGKGEYNYRAYIRNH